MKLTLSPQRGLPGQTETTLSVSGETLIHDGISYDLSVIPEGGEAVPEGDEHPFVGKITRQGGVIHCKVRVTLGPDAADDQPPDWAHWTIPDAEGDVVIPALRKPQEPEQEVEE